MRGPSDPSRTSLFYWVLAVGVSIVLSLAGYALLRLTLHGQAITALETWRDLRGPEMVRDTALLQQIRDTVSQSQQTLLTLHTRVSLLENTLTFQGAQLDYLLAWEKQQPGREAPMRPSPR